MAQFSSRVQATSNTVANTEDAFVDVDAPASTDIRIKRVRVSVDTAGNDDRTRIRLLRKSATGAGGAAGTIVKKDPNSPASVSSTTIKSGVTAFATGTITDVLDEVSLNGRGIFEWVARDEDDYIRIVAGGIFGINLVVSGVSIVENALVEWLE